MGTHRLGNESLEPGSWTVADADGNELGMMTLTGRRLSGLADVFHAASIRSGANVSLSFVGGDDLVTLSVHQCDLS